MATSDYYPLIIYAVIAVVGIIMTAMSGGSIVFPLVGAAIVAGILWVLGYYRYVGIAWVILGALIAVFVVTALLR